MDRVRIGNTFRAIRLELHLRQADVADRAGVSQPIVSSIERGLSGPISLDKLERVAGVLQAELAVTLRWRGPNLARLLDRRHATLSNAVAAELREIGWQMLPEDTFNEFGDRGAVDILAWRQDERALLIVEIKTELVDLQEMLRTLDMKSRVVPGQVRRRRGWRVDCVATVVVMPGTSTHRRAVANHDALLGAALPGRTVEIRRWLATPAGHLRGIWFFPCIGQVNGMELLRAKRRVRKRSGQPNGATRGTERAGPPVSAPQAPEHRVKALIRGEFSSTREPSGRGRLP